MHCSTMNKIMVSTQCYSIYRSEPLPMALGKSDWSCKSSPEERLSLVTDIQSTKGSHLNKFSNNAPGARV